MDRGYKAVAFFDLDGTLFDKNSRMTPSVRDLLIRLKANGVLPVAATGRSPREIEELTSGSGIDSYVSMNGQYIVLEKQVIHKNAFSTEVMDQLSIYAAASKHPLGFYSRDISAVSAVDVNVEGLFAMDHLPIPPVIPDFYKDHSVYLMGVFMNGDFSDYSEHFCETLSFVRDSPYSLAVIPRNGSKGEGIRIFMERLGLEGLHTYAFGDGNNDLEMFDAVDTAVAMGNAVDALKAKADYITASNEENGILLALEHLKLI